MGGARKRGKRVSVTAIAIIIFVHIISKGQYEKNLVIKKINLY